MRIHHLPGLTQYSEALNLQEQAVEDVLNGGEQVAFFLEHPPIFTLGSGADAQTELLNPGDIPTIQTSRGGKITYHGPGQRVVYVVRDLRHRKDIRAHITDLQNWLIQSLADLGVQAHTTDDVGVWTDLPTETLKPNTYHLKPSAKLAAIGVRVRKWVAFHGIALNVNPDLSPYNRIIPCGLNLPVTSLQALGSSATMQQVDEALIKNLPALA